MTAVEPPRNLKFVSTNIIVTKDGKVLFSRRKNTGWADGMLVLPGGHVEANETPRQAIIRELAEELGVVAVITDITFCCVAQRKSGDREYVAYEFTLTLHEQQEPINNESELCAELVWCDPRSLPADVVPDFADIVTDGLLKGRPYLELGYL